MAKGLCRCCGGQYTINKDETIRYHFAEDPECQTSSDSRRCKGVGQLPQGAGNVTETGTGEPDGYICRVCHHPVQLTANDRARSHLDPRTNPPASCAGGSDWPLVVQLGERMDTAPQGEVLPAAAPEDLLFAGDDGAGGGALADGRTPEQQAEMDRRRADPLGAAVEEIRRVVKDPGTVADVSPAIARRMSLCTVGDLDEGVLFQRHTSPLPDLVFRVQGGVYDADGPVSVTAIIVTAGPYAGREGELTDMTEEVTCTDLNGNPRPRRTTSKPSSAPSPGPAPARAPGSMPTGKASAAAVTSPSTKAPSSVPTGKEAGKPPTAAETTTDPVEQFLAGASGARGEDEGRYDGYGRYLLRHPVHGREVAWTRTTTFAKSVTDTFTLDQWQRRCVLLGTTVRPDLVAEATGMDVTRDRNRLNAMTEELKESAGAKVAADWGTAVHSYTELCDRSELPGHELKKVPEQFQPHVSAYLEMLDDTGLEPLPTLIEFSTGVLQYEVMGTSDRCYRVTRPLLLKMPRGEVQLLPGEFIIGDVKTGKDLDYGWQEIAIQLAVYAQGLNTLGRYDWKAGAWDPKPLEAYAEPGTKVRLDVGVIPHLPVDPRSTKKPALYGVDLESGWNAAVLCERVRAWRKVKTLAGPVTVVNGSQTAPHARQPTLQERAETVTSRTEASLVFQAALAAGLPEAERNRLVALMQERLHALAEPGGARV